MRPRKKKNADARIARTAKYLAQNPAAQRGRWAGGGAEKKPLYLELGCGKGAFALALAAREPDSCIIAMEKVKDVLVTALELAAENAPGNLRFILGDCRDLDEYFADGEIDRIYINFCDPWHKARHYKRRLTYRGFLELYRRKLAPGGKLYFKTDNAPLFDFSLEEFEAVGAKIISITRDLQDPCNIVTEYEKMWSERGFKINRAIIQLT